MGASSGVAAAEAFIYDREPPVIPESYGSAEEELERFKAAVASAKSFYSGMTDKAKARTDGKTAEIFEAYLEFLDDDDSVIEPVCELIASGSGAAKAVHEHFEMLAGMMSALEDETLRERAADFRELGDRLVREILGIKAKDISSVERDVILFAHDLAPADTVNMDAEHIKGIVTEIGGCTSHTAILANAMSLPAVVGCAGVLSAVKDGDGTAIDGETGEVVLRPDEAAMKRFDEKKALSEQDGKALEMYRSRPTLTADGHARTVSANVASASACAEALAAGCDGVGLLRSEFLYMESNGLPDEARQCAAYGEALEVLKGRHVTIRTLDAGGDKELKYLDLPPEQNPFMGYRAIRICLDRRELFMTQLRALLKASVKGELHIMFPMVSSLEEFREAKAAVQEARRQLADEGEAVADNVKVGLMIEIPAAAVMADVFAKEADFFSIGTNDLTQYTTAVDRGNERVQKLYTHYNPGVIRLIAWVIRSAHEGGIPCCMCGEAAGDLAFVPALLGMGLDEFSVSVPKITRVRRLISELSYEECSAKAELLLKAETAAQVKNILNGMQPEKYRK